MRASSRENIQQSALDVLEVWNQAEASWEPLPGVTVASFGTLLSTSAAQKVAHTQKFTAWREASAA